MFKPIPSLEDTDANIQNIKEQNYRAFAFDFKQKDSSYRTMLGRFMSMDGDLFWKEIANLTK